MLYARWIAPIIMIAFGTSSAYAQGGPGAGRSPLRAVPRPGGPSMTLDGHHLILEEAVPLTEVEGDDFAPPRMLTRTRPAVSLKSARLAAVNFDNWIFGDGMSEEGGRDLLARSLLKQVAVATAKHGLSDAERAKLYQAGQGDLKRFLDRIAGERKGFESARTDGVVGAKALMDESAVVRALRRIDPLAIEFRQGPFGEGSFFAKVLEKILADRKAANGIKA
jgi:hypothetical protein